MEFRRWVGVVETESGDVLGRQSRDMERRTVAERRGVADDILVDVDQPVAPQFKPCPPLSQHDVQSRTHRRRRTDRVCDEDRHPGRSEPPRGGGRTAACTASCEVQHGRTRADVDERSATAVEQIDLEQFGVWQQRRAALGDRAAAAAGTTSLLSVTDASGNCSTVNPSV